MSIVAGIAEELHVFQEMTWANVDKLIDEFINQYGFAPQEIRVSEAGQRKLEADLPRLGLEPALLSKLSRYRGVTVKTQETFSDDTIELVAFEDKMSESNICEICGGEKSIAYLLETLPTATIPVAANLPYKACMGHPKGAPKHDGRLDEYQNGYNECRVFRINDVSVLVMEKSGSHLTYTPGILIDGVGDMVSLTAKQAISLLSWLEQNRAELTALAEAMDK